MLLQEVRKQLKAELTSFPQKDDLNSNTPGVKYCLPCCLSTFSSINKTLFKSTESCLQMKKITLLSNRKFSFNFRKLLDGHLGLELTPRISTQPLLPVKS